MSFTNWDIFTIALAGCALLFLQMSIVDVYLALLDLYSDRPEFFWFLVYFHVNMTLFTTICFF